MTEFKLANFFSGLANIEKYLANHQLDAKGRLIQYDIANNPGGADVSFQAILNWKCK